MDHDTHDKRIRALETALDVLTDRQWRDTDSLRRRGYGRGDRPAHLGDRGEAMVVDEEQTLRDRIALGLEPNPDAPPVGDRAQPLGDNIPIGKQYDPDAKDDGNRTDTKVQGDAPGPNVTLPKTAVALGAANASPETEAALETAQDPQRQAEAEKQAAEKARLDDARAVDKTQQK